MRVICSRTPVYKLKLEYSRYLDFSIEVFAILSSAILYFIVWSTFLAIFNKIIVFWSDILLDDNLHHLRAQSYFQFQEPCPPGKGNFVYWEEPCVLVEGALYFAKDFPLVEGSLCVKSYIILLLWRRLPLVEGSVFYWRGLCPLFWRAEGISVPLLRGNISQSLREILLNRASLLWWQWLFLLMLKFWERHIKTFFFLLSFFWNKDNCSFVFSLFCTGC